MPENSNYFHCDRDVFVKSSLIKPICGAENDDTYNPYVNYNLSHYENTPIQIY